MTTYSYRLSIALILTTLSGVGVFVLANESDMSISSLVRDAIATTLPSDERVPDTQPIIPKIEIKIENIISKRYLDTLHRAILQELGQSLGTRVTLDLSYASYENITLEGDDFIFQFGSNEAIHIPTSSFFFDLYNKTQNVFTISGKGVPMDKKVIALTFDDGPSQRYTETLLDILKKEGVIATFFVLGKNAERFPDIIKREHDEGHEIGNHSYSHQSFIKLGSGQIRDELYATDQAVYRATGEYPRTFRPPYGATNTGILADIAMPIAMLSIDSRDWQTHSVAKSIASIAHAKSGDIVIMHDIHETAIASIPTIIAILRDRGFTFVTVSDILELSPSNEQIGKKCYKQGNCK